MPSVCEAFNGVTLGADPELLVINDEGKVVCAEGLIPGTKQEPFPVEYGAVQVDGFAAEYNIDPASTYKEWERNHVAVQKQLKDMLPTGYNLIAKPSYKFTEQEWDNAPAIAKEVGCSPDFNAWKGEVNSPIQYPKGWTTVAVGGHVHFGFTQDADTSDEHYVEASVALCRQLDWYLGGWSLNFDRDKVRRKLFGNAGSMRFKPYGIEYRVLSNFWVLSKARRLDVWNRSHMAMKHMSTNFLGGLRTKSEKMFSERLIKSIETGVRNNDVFDSYYFPLKELEIM